MLHHLVSDIYFWCAWIIIPILFEIIPAVMDSVILLVKRSLLRETKPLSFIPTITLMIPVYNSEKTLYRCLESVARSSYPSDKIEVILVDNGSRDNSFQMFQKAQVDFPDLPMWWISSKQGKSKALNKAIFNSEGKYIMNIDSDGVLETDALLNAVKKFENNSKIDCMTGVILIEPQLIEKTENFFLHQFRKLEFMEYCQAFLAGRNFESQFNSIYTLSGAFSMFRKSVLLKTYLYNTNTICEDTHLTFQMKTVLHRRVYLCDDAVFMVDPIESVNKFYTQRQRWQIGELEVAHMFMKKKMKNPLLRFFTNPELRLIMMDHTFAFPRMIWYFALFALGCINYKFDSILKAVMLIYLLYVFTCFLYYLNILTFLDKFKDLKRYYAQKLGYLFLMPVFNLFAFFVRFAGIINSITRKASWKTYTLTEEYAMCEETVKQDFHFLFRFRQVVSWLLEKQPETPGESLQTEKGKKLL